MSRFSQYLGIVVALLFGALFVFVSSSVPISRAPTKLATDVASTTIPQLDIVASTTTFTSLEPEKSEENTVSEAENKTQNEATEPSKNELTPKGTSVIETAPAPVPVALSLSSNTSFDSSATTLRSALVNIICIAPQGSSAHSISGSGVVVDLDGIIITNAHIAQYFLLADKNVTCKIRSGSPAVDSYEASLVYLSHKWIQANANILTEASPVGTGEYDFAFIAITKSATSAPLPSSFPFIPLATTPPTTGTPVVIASYGAQFLESSQIQSFLFPTVVFGSVKDVFTFASTTIDVLALGGSAAAQEGSSGGGVSDIYGELVGVITTSTTKGPTSARALGAITSSYIRSEYASETGDTLETLLAKSPTTAVADFAPRIPALESIITAQLP